MFDTEKNIFHEKYFLEFFLNIWYVSKKLLYQKHLYVIKQNTIGGDLGHGKGWNGHGTGLGALDG